MSLTTTPKQNFLSHSDTWVGLVLCLIGGTAAALAVEFDMISRKYPFALGIILLMLGVVLIIRAARGFTEHATFQTVLPVVLPATLIVGGWISALILGLGYLLPTFLMQLAFLLFCGVTSVIRAAVYATLIAGISYQIFIHGLNVRLPEPLAPWLL